MHLEGRSPSACTASLPITLYYPATFENTATKYAKGVGYAGRELFHRLNT